VRPIGSIFPTNGVDVRIFREVDIKTLDHDALALVSASAGEETNTKALLTRPGLGSLSGEAEPSLIRRVPRVPSTRSWIPRSLKVGSPAALVGNRGRV
jgi:hypothetical protein